MRTADDNTVIAAQQIGDAAHAGTADTATNSTNADNLGGVPAASYALDTDINATNVGTVLAGAAAKATPVDADTLPLNDSAASNALKKLSWANIKATLKTYFDAIYQAILVSGTNIKTVNGNSLLGAGDLSVSAGSWTPVIKTADEVRASTTTPTDDATLKFNVTAGKRYMIRLRLVYTAGANGVQTQMLAPAGTIWRGFDIQTNPAAAAMTHRYGTLTTAFNITQNIAQGTRDAWFTIDVSTTGVFSIQWAQNTNGATNTTMLKGSYIEYMEIA